MVKKYMVSKNNIVFLCAPLKLNIISLSINNLLIVNL